MHSLKISSVSRILLISIPKSYSVPLSACHIETKSGCAVPPETGFIARSIPSAPPSSAAKYAAKPVPAVS